MMKERKESFEGGISMDFKIIAVDFDGTLCEGKWPDIGLSLIHI